MKKLMSLMIIIVSFFFMIRILKSEESSVISGDQALQKLLEGNKRYTEDKLTHPDQTAERRTEVVKGQHPFAVILSCSDSRIPPEVIFDQGIGNLFVIRVAGNSVDNVVLGSIEYAVEHLGTPLILVLGHEKCGAIEATLKGGTFPGHIFSLVEPLRSAVEKAKSIQGDLLDNTVRANIELVVQQLKSSEPILTEFLNESKLKIVGARYDLDDGKVEIIVL